MNIEEDMKKLGSDLSVIFPVKYNTEQVSSYAYH